MQVEVDEGQRQGEGQRVVPALPQVEEQRHVPQGEAGHERGEEPVRRVAEQPPSPEEEPGEAREGEREPGGEGVATEEAEERRGVEVLEGRVGAVLDAGELEASAEGDDVGAVEGVGVAGLPDVGGEDAGVGLVVPEGVGAEVQRSRGATRRVASSASRPGGRRFVAAAREGAEVASSCVLIARADVVARVARGVHEDVTRTVARSRSGVPAPPDQPLAKQMV